MTAGRPRRYSNKQIKEICQRLEEYIANESVPIVAEFAYKNDIPRNALYDYPEFSTLIKKLIDKKESRLERLALNGKVNSTMAIFSLKQIGWRDIPKEEDDSQNKLDKLVEAIATNVQRDTEEGSEGS